MKKVVLAIMFLLLGVAVMRADSVVTSRPAGTDSVDWSQLGTVGADIPNPFSFTTTDGVSGTGSYAGTAGYFGDVGQVAQQGNNWAGHFLPDDYLNWTANDGALTLNFAQGYTQIGAEIEPDFLAPFTAQICDVNDGVCFTENGSSENGAPIYIGISNGTPITSVTFSLASAYGAPNDFTINEVTLDGGSPVAPTPEPGTLLLMGSGLATMAATLRRKFARR